jgi:Domain of unknown function (DUF4157)/L,D-transpeptidase catalytic domain
MVISDFGGGLTMRTHAIPAPRATQNRVSESMQSRRPLGRSLLPDKFRGVRVYADAQKRPVPAGVMATRGAERHSRMAQAKLTLGRSDDRFEREADTFADAVLGRGDAASLSQVHTRIQRQAEESESQKLPEESQETPEESPETQDESPEPLDASEKTPADILDALESGAAESEDGSVVEQGDEVQAAAGESVEESEEEKEEAQLLRESGASGSSGAVAQLPSGSGRPLDIGVRDFMRERSGHDFAGVRIHTDPDAQVSARRLSARAFTVGNDVYFARGEYRPHATDGRHLIAHELAHVVQQSGGVLSRQIQRQQRGAGGGRGAPSPPTRIVIHLVPGGRGGHADVYSGKRILRRMTITSGRSSHPTPTGTFTLDTRDTTLENHRSTEYGQCIDSRGHARDVGQGAASCRRGQPARPARPGRPAQPAQPGERYVGAMMRFFRVFTWSGRSRVGFHVGSLGQASHGCIHLGTSDARWLWNNVPAVTVEVSPPARQRGRPVLHTPRGR